MPKDRILRSSWQRISRPRNWSEHMFATSASASHVAPKTGGYRAVRHMIAEVRALEAARIDEDTHSPMERNRSSIP